MVTLRSVFMQVGQPLPGGTLTVVLNSLWPAFRMLSRSRLRSRSMVAVIGGGLDGLIT
jgi:hypothetical protein